MSDIFRRRTVRTLITRFRLSPQEAGKEYAKHKFLYNNAADYHWPETKWDDAQEMIAQVYMRNIDRQW